MATEIEELLIKISADNTAFQAKMDSALSTVEKTTKEMQKEFQDFAKESTKNTSLVSQAVATMGGILGSKVVLGAVEQLKNAFRFLGQQLMEGLESSRAQEEALTRLSVALGNAGNFSVEARNDFESFANTIEATTGVADDAVISAGALLASMAGLSGQGLERATEAAVNLSAAIGIDLQSAAQLMAKAANGQVTALQRYGIVVQEGTSNTETFANALGQIEGQFGGFAEKLQGTFSGSLKNATNQVGNLFETLAESVRTNQVLVATFNAVAKVFSELEQLAKDNSDELRIFVGEAILKTIEALRALVVVMDTVRMAFQFVIFSVNTIVDAIQTRLLFAINNAGKGFSALKDIMTGDLREGFGAIKEIVKDGAQDIGDFADRTSSEFQKVTQNSEMLVAVDAALSRVGQAAEIAFEQTKQGAQALAEPINSSTAALGAMSQELEALLEKSKEFNDTQQRAKEEGVSFDTAIILEQQEAEQAILEEGLARKQITQQEYYDAVNMMAETTAQKLNDINQKLVDQENEKQKQRAANFSATLGTISSLASSKSKELAAVGKAAAIAQATMDTYAGANKALASAPPPFNFALAAAVVAAGIANVAKIAGTPLQSGIDSVPGIGNKDNFPAILAPGERVVPRETNKDLKEFLQDDRQQAPSVSVVVQVQGDFFESDEANQKLVERIQRTILQTGFKLQT